MKSLVFKNAWNIVKSMGVSISIALSISWSEAKLNKMFNSLILAKSKAFNYSEEKAIEEKIALETRKLKSIKPCHVCYTNENNGAKYDYGVGLYNGD